MQRTSVVYIIAFAALLIACGQKQGPEPIESAPAPQAGSPSASTQPAPVNAPFMQGQSADPIEQGRSLPLRLSGLNSVEELNRGLARLQDAESRQLFEEAFRKTFTADQSGRNYSDAEAKFQQVLRKSEKSAEAYRGLGYALFNRGQAEAALANYLKAIEISPDYGEAHYAVAFLYAMGDTSKGKLHYQKAMQLGIPDERKLGERFYK
ncbi:MAG: tetratricopeptide repeat protein [Acidobacteria bacterium]|nr:tetratricopeptide repeat protein [Acidobacteriota bacterium]